MSVGFSCEEGSRSRHSKINRGTVPHFIIIRATFQGFGDNQMLQGSTIEYLLPATKYCSTAVCRRCDRTPGFVSGSLDAGKGYNVTGLD